MSLAVLQLPHLLPDPIQQIVIDFVAWAKRSIAVLGVLSCGKVLIGKRFYFPGLFVDVAVQSAHLDAQRPHPAECRGVGGGRQAVHKGFDLLRGFQNSLEVFRGN